MTGKKLSVVNGSQPPAIRSSTKAFDDFAAMAEDLGDHYEALRKTLKEADNQHTSTEHKLKRVADRLGYIAMMGWPSRSIAKCERFLQPYEDGIDDDDRHHAEVAKKVAQLVGCYGNANVGDPEVFVRTLIDEVAGTEQSLIVIEAAFRKLRRTEKFLPAISEVLTKIDEQSKAWRPRFDAIQGGVECLKEDLESKRIELEQKLEADKERKRLAQEAADRNRVAFPLKTSVGHSKYGLGVVEDYPGKSITIGFGPPNQWGRRRQYDIPPEELVRVSNLPEYHAVLPGSRVFHERFGPGVIVNDWGPFVLVVNVRFDRSDSVQGIREVMRDFLMMALPETAGSSDDVSTVAGSDERSMECSNGSNVEHESFISPEGSA